MAATRLLSSLLIVTILLFTSFPLHVNGQSSKNTKLESRVQQLLDWTARKSIITMSSEKFNIYVKSRPRNYSVIAMLTALKPQRQCTVCKQAYDEYEILANSWRYSQQYSTQLFFIMIDIDEDGMDIFQQLRLTTAPTYFHFPSAGKRKSEDKYDITRFGFMADPLANWVADRTGVKISIVRPPNFTVMLIWIPLLLLAAIVGYLKRENLHILYDSKLWAAFAMGWIFIMLSGQMWNHIRGPPFYHRNPQTGQIGYFSGTSQYQFIAETYIIMGLYACISIGVVLMGDRFKLFEEMGIQKFIPVIGLGLVVIIFGYLLSIFRAKYGGYPYSFLFS